MADSEILVEGDDSFILGSNSSVYPAKLGPGEYFLSMNTINRGGIIQTRPGSESLIFEEDIPGTNLQGITMFKPSNGPASLVFMVDGLVYYSPYPFKQYHQLTNLKFSKYSKYASWASTVQSTDYTPDGVLHPLDTPRAILIIQDGYTRAAYWDGSNSAHIDPTPSNMEFTIVGKDGTPVGLWMKWSNNRLWVSRGSIVFASDIGNPLKFADSQFLAEGRAFYLPAPCTGMTEASDQSGIICFTADAGVFITTSIQDRSTWLSTPGFIRTVLPSIGCVSPRSIVQQHGLVWWMTPKGLISLNDALKLYISSKLDIEDQEMAASKSNMSHDISMVCGSFFENFLFHAIPSGDKWNTRLHVMDQAPIDEEMYNSWPSYWEGWRPVEFARGVISSKERIFCLSKDRDGVNRIWELFTNDRTDNGIPITSYVETKLHLFQNREYKRFKYAEIEAVNIWGPTAFMIAVAGMRGAYQNVGTKDVASQIGQAYPEEYYGDMANNFAVSSRQMRIIKSKETPDASDCNAHCTESIERGMIDKGFSLTIVWSGIAGISAYRVFAQMEQRQLTGQCEENETGVIHMLSEDGCGTEEMFSTERAFDLFVSSQEYTQGDVTATSSASSVISQVDADRKAERTARWYALSDAGYLTISPSALYEAIVPVFPRTTSIHGGIFE